MVNNTDATTQSNDVTDDQSASDNEDMSRTDRPKSESKSPPQLVSRVLVTWLELTLVGITGGLLGTTVGGPPGFIIYLVTTLITVSIIFYNVNELIKGWMRSTNG